MVTDPVNAIESRGLWKTYPGDVQAIRDLDLSLKPGKICIIAGPNGAGKTTFLRMVSTERLPTRGELSVLGHDVSSTDGQLAIKRKIGVMPQEARLYPHLTVWEHVYYFTLLKDLTKVKAREETERVMDLLKLQGLRKKIVDYLSGGQKSQVSLAQALAGDSDLLLLDEPTTGLDPGARRHVWDVINNISRDEKTIVITTHYLDEGQAIADDAIIFNRGSIVTKGSVCEVMAGIRYGARIEIDHRKELVRSLEAIEPPLRWIVENGKMVLLVRNDEMDEVIGSLLSSGVKISEITISRPSLEEAYLDILGAEHD